jgi:DNA-binding transcriptional ArsR family regulator
MKMTDELFEPVADRFRARGEPARRRILNARRNGEAAGGELVEATGRTQANQSKQLQMLHARGVVHRRKQGRVGD